MCAEQVTPAVMPAYRGYNPYAYQGLVSCMDTTADIIGSYPMGPAGGFGPSIFGGCMPYGGGMPFCGGMPGMYGMGPGFEVMNMTTEQAMDYNSRINSKRLNHGVELSRQTQNANYQAAIHNNMVAEKAAVLRSLIKENNQDQVATAYENLKEAVRAKLVYEGGNALNEHKVETEAKKLYAEAMQANIPDDLRKYGDAPFMAGFKKALGGIGWLFMEKNTSIENIAEVEGTKIPKSEKAKEIAGGIVSVALTLAGLLLLHKGYKKFNEPHTVNVFTKAAKTVAPETKLANLEAHIKEFEGDPRFKSMLKSNYYDNIADLHQAHIDGRENLVFTAGEKELFDAYLQTQEAASKLRNDIFSAKHKAAMS